MLERWWTEKYNLPPNHPLYLGRALSDLRKEWWLDLFRKRESLEALLEHGDLDAQARHRVHSQLSRLDRVLDASTSGEETGTGDPLIDKWEREWAEGKMPDLTEEQP